MHADYRYVSFTQNSLWVWVVYELYIEIFAFKENEWTKHQKDHLNASNIVPLYYNMCVCVCAMCTLARLFAFDLGDFH